MILKKSFNCVFLSFFLIIFSSCNPKSSVPVINEVPHKSPLIRDDSEAPVTIHYGLNDSNSNSWVQRNGKDTIGIVYFKLNQKATSGNLIYKTIQINGAENEEIVTSGSHLEISVLLFDTENHPHIFVAKSNENNQHILHFYKTNGNKWKKEISFSFENEGGKYIYELSAALGKNNTYHLLILKTRSNPDSADYFYSYRNSHLYHLYFAEQKWNKSLIHSYDTFYTLDEYSKAFRRQDIAVDYDGNVHVVFGEELDSLSDYSSSRLCYANNSTGKWEIENAIIPAEGTRDSAGWYPSIAIKRNGNPVISCTYIARVKAGSAMNARLLYIERLDVENWVKTIIAKSDDGYYGTDGRNYTGALSHLVIDSDDIPHIIFSDIASSHNSSGINYFNIGNIRYATYKNNKWIIKTVYHQPKPNNFFKAKEMYGQCLSISNNGKNISVLGQELITYSENNYFLKLVSLTLTL